MLTYNHGDLFKARTVALVNPVNTVGVMGAGLALKFKTAFDENHQLYVAACQQGGRSHWPHVCHTAQLRARSTTPALDHQLPNQGRLAQQVAHRLDQRRID